MHLHRRLDILSQVQDDAACQRLRASMRLLSADIDVAIAEARHLQAVEADVSQESAEDGVAQQVSMLHEQVAGCDAVAQRVGEVQRQLGTLEEAHTELKNFSRDLAGAEAQAQRASELLIAAGEAAREMKQTVEANKAQMAANMSALERKP